jgi:hypothetical protein
MSADHEVAHKALRRMLANGPLTAIPRRPDDQALLLRLAASRFEPGTPYRENEVNERLKDWLATFCAPFGIDHVTLRRMLVDERLLVRDNAGARYHAEAQPIPRAPGEAPQPGAVLEEVRSERAARRKLRSR